MFSSRDREKCEELLEKYYAGRKFFDARYREMIGKHLRPGQRLLDAGCGRYMSFCREFSVSASVVGIDLDSVLETDNRRPPFGVRGDLSRLPFPPEYFDIVISRAVIEHVEAPPLVFREFARVLRPGGKIVIITPNKYDYVSLIAAVTPHRLHQLLVSRIFPVSEHDVFPTLYRANTPSALRKAMNAAGLDQKELEMLNHYPAYLMFSPLLFRLGILYERLTSLEALRLLRGWILCVYEKPANGRPEGNGRPATVVPVRTGAGK